VTSLKNQVGLGSWNGGLKETDGNDKNEMTLSEA